jgi:hypothetical protein
MELQLATPQIGSAVSMQINSNLGIQGYPTHVAYLNLLLFFKAGSRLGRRKDFTDPALDERSGGSGCALRFCWPPGWALRWLWAYLIRCEVVALEAEGQDDQTRRDRTRTHWSKSLHSSE